MFVLVLQFEIGPHTQFVLFFFSPLPVIALHNCDAYDTHFKQNRKVKSITIAESSDFGVNCRNWTIVVKIQVSVWDPLTCVTSGYVSSENTLFGYQWKSFLHVAGKEALKRRLSVNIESRMLHYSNLYWFLGYCATSQPLKGWTQTPNAWLLVCLWVKTCMLKKSFKLKYHLFVITMQNLGRQMYEMQSYIE